MNEDRAMDSPRSPAVNATDDAGGWVSARIGRGHYQAELRARSHTVNADEPITRGGSDRGPTPYELLLGALSSCTVITLRMYADRKGWPLEWAEVRLRTARSHGEDCENCEAADVGITSIEREVELSGELTDEQRGRLLEIADRCPVKRTLEQGIRIVPA
jgi:putative redox protein